MAVNKDTILKNHVCDILNNCQLTDLVLDREVHLNLDGTTDNHGVLVHQKEIDVVAKFSYAGKRIALFFECEDSKKGRSVREHYKAYDTQIKDIQHDPSKIEVVSSLDKQIGGWHFTDIDEIHVCFVYGKDFSPDSYAHCESEGRKYKFLIWNHWALEYYRRISFVLLGWTKYELFKDFSLALEDVTTTTIAALQIKQKNQVMYVASIHPGLLLKIAYVTRRASEKTYAYQRMLNKERIRAIASFVSKTDAKHFLPNAVLVVFDSDAQTQRAFKYDQASKLLTIPVRYCSAWIIDGQHRVFGFVGTKYEHWNHDSFERFDLPIVLFQTLKETTQTQTFININYNQQRIKSDLLCDLATLTKDLRHKLTWASLLGHELNDSSKSPLKDRVRINELHSGRPISLASLVQYGLLETLLGYRKTGEYKGRLYEYSSFNTAQSFESEDNQKAFKEQISLLVRFMNAVKKNTTTGIDESDPWINETSFALLRATGLNACFLLLARILERYPELSIDLERFLKPLESVDFRRDHVSKMGGGWKGFRALANKMIRKINRGKSESKTLRLYGEKEKL